MKNKPKIFSFSRIILMLFVSASFMFADSTLVIDQYENETNEESPDLPFENTPLKIILPIKYVNPIPDSIINLPKEETAPFCSAQVLFNRKAWNDALPIFTSISESKGLLKNYAKYFKILILLNLNKPIDAVQAYISLQAETIEPFLCQRALLALFNRNLPDKAEDQLKLAEKVIAKKNLPEFQYQLALLCLKAKDTSNAINNFLAILKSSETTMLSDSAYDNFLNYAKERFSPTDEQKYVFCRYLERRMKFEQLLFHSLPAAAKEGPYQEHFLRQSFNASYKIKRYKEALIILNRLNKFKNNEPYTLYKTAQCLEKMKFFIAAHFKHKEYLKKYPSGDFGDDILWDAGRRMEKKKNYPSAIKYYRRIATQYTKSSFADDAYFRMGYCFFKNNDYDSSIQVLSRFDRQFKESPLSDAVPYWIAKNWQAKNIKDSTIYYYLKTVEHNIYSFYAYRVRDILKTDVDSLRLDSIVKTPSLSIDKFYNEISFEKNSKKGVWDNNNYTRGLMLLKVGCPDLALPELKVAETILIKDPVQYHNLTRIYETYGLFYDAFRMTLRMMMRIRDPDFAKSPVELRKMFFPRYYGEAIDLECKKYGFDPLFIHSIIRQESVYDYKIMSPAGAIGLLQLMPTTAADVAKKMQIKFAFDSLFNPFYNLKLGIYHIIELMDRFNGSHELTLCAYNAGTYVTRDWEQKGKSLSYDEFVEEIGYSETRNYVKKCMRNYLAYQDIWGANKTEEP